MKTEEIAYRGYELQVVHHPPMWQVGIYPTGPGMTKPRPEAQHVSFPDRAEAIAEAKRRVDSLLAC